MSAKTVKASMIAKGTCPSCEGDVWIAEEVRSAALVPSEPTQHLMHKDPPCAEFLDMDADPVPYVARCKMKSVGAS